MYEFITFVVRQPDGTEVTVAYKGAGDHFGEGALLASHISLGGVEGTLPRVASVRV